MMSISRKMHFPDQTELDFYSTLLSSAVLYLWAKQPLPSSLSEYEELLRMPLTVHIRHLLSVTKLPLEQFYMALKIVQVLTASFPELTNVPVQGSEVRVYISSLIVVNKYYEDHFISKKSWSKVSGMSLVELNKMELEILLGLRWNLELSLSDYVEWIRWTEELGTYWSHVFGGGSRMPSPSPQHVLTPALSANSSNLSLKSAASAAAAAAAATSDLVSNSASKAHSLSTSTSSSANSTSHSALSARKSGSKSNSSISSCSTSQSDAQSQFLAQQQPWAGLPITPCSAGGTRNFSKSSSVHSSTALVTPLSMPNPSVRRSRRSTGQGRVQGYFAVDQIGAPQSRFQAQSNFPYPLQVLEQTNANRQQQLAIYQQQQQQQRHHEQQLYNEQLCLNQGHSKKNHDILRPEVQGIIVQHQKQMPTQQRLAHAHQLYNYQQRQQQQFQLVQQQQQFNYGSFDTSKNAGFSHNEVTSSLQQYEREQIKKFKQLQNLRAQHQFAAESRHSSQQASAHLQLRQQKLAQFLQLHEHHMGLLGDVQAQVRSSASNSFFKQQSLNGVQNSHSNSLPYGSQAGDASSSSCSAQPSSHRFTDSVISRIEDQDSFFLEASSSTGIGYDLEQGHGARYYGPEESAGFSYFGDSISEVMQSRQHPSAHRSRRSSAYSSFSSTDRPSARSGVSSLSGAKCFQQSSPLSSSVAFNYAP